MAEYIKREDAMKALDEHRLSHTMSMHGDMEMLIEYRDGVIGAMNALAFVPAADVVPKSEVEMLQGALKAEERHNELTMEMAQKALKNAKAEVAREIFEDIKCSILAMSTLALFSYTDNLEESNAKQKCYKYVSELIDELDKRYTGGEPNDRR
ncbi:MAG: hypothetical protein J6V22_03210 [Clostridia bacterium]|nr:hypothetical protein [Clostridia bacterium]